MTSAVSGAPIRSYSGIAGAAVLPGAGSVETLPQPNSCDEMQDMLSSLFALLSQSGRDQSAAAQNNVKLNRVQRQAEELRIREATDRARREAEDGGIFKKLTDNIGLLGVVGLATFNYTLVAADIGMHASGLVKNLKLDVADGACAVLAQTHPEILAADILLRKLDVTPDAVKDTLNKMGLGTDVPGISDEDVKPVVKTAVELNLLVAGAAASVLSAGTTTALVVALVAVAMSSGAFAAQKCDAPPWLVIGLQVGGAALSFGAGLASNTGAVLRTGSELAAAKAVGHGVNGVNTAMNGTDTIIHAVAQKKVDDANIDAKEARNRLAKLQRILDDLIDAVGESQDATKRATGCAQKALDTYNQTLVSTSAALKA